MLGKDLVSQMGYSYPIFLDLEGVAVLVVGGGPIALRKAAGLAEAGAIVTAIAPDLVDGFDSVARRIERRRYRRGDVADYQLVIAATNDPAVNAQVAADARAKRVWVNSADDPNNCSFILPAVARRGPLIVAVSTGGASPALASRMRTSIADTYLTAAVEAAAIELASQRAEIHASGASTEDIDWAERVDAALAANKVL